MTNRDFMTKTCSYDILMQMNNGIYNKYQQCIMNCFMPEKDVAKRCHHDCSYCIKDFLKEDYVKYSGKDPERSNKGYIKKERILNYLSVLQREEPDMEDIYQTFKRIILECPTENISVTEGE